MLAVALFAGRRVGRASLVGFAMDAGREFLIRLRVAGAAAHPGKPLRMGKFLNGRIRVAGRAFEPPMDR